MCILYLTHNYAYNLYSKAIPGKAELLSPDVTHSKSVNFKGALCYAVCPVTSIIYQHVVLVLHICNAIDLKRLQGCEFRFT